MFAAYLSARLCLYNFASVQMRICLSFVGVFQRLREMLPAAYLGPECCSSGCSTCSASPD